MNDWNEKIIREFREHGGRVGGPFEGAPMVLIHHIGARSGTVRVSPLVSFPEDDGSFLVVASKGGAPTNPDWYHNVLAHPRFQVEAGTATFEVEATELRADERASVWPRIVADRPGFAEYERKTSRVIPVLRLRPVA